MAERRRILSERVDDISLLLAQLERLGVRSLLDEYFPVHGHWVGLSLGWVAERWLTHLLSEADHRLNHVEPWAEQRLHTLRGCTGQPVHPLDVGDDRLAGVLEALSDEARWAAFEGALNRQRLRVYDLQPACVRLDSTAASGQWTVTAGGLLQFGHSKDHRPDLPQVKVMLAALDPLGLPVATDVVPGQRADDPLYVPAIVRVRESLGRRGVLYVGDCQLGARETRAFIQVGDDAYRCPLSAIQLPPNVWESYLMPIGTGQQPLTRITRLTATGKRAYIADGDVRLEPLTAVVAGEVVTWTERRLVVRSRQLVRAGEAALRARLAKAPTAVAALHDRGRGKPRFTEPPALQAAVEAILTRYRVQGLLAVHSTDHVQARLLRRDGSRPPTVRVEREVQATAVVDRHALAGAICQLGWRVYATNAPSAQLSLSQAVRAYRSEDLVARDMGRLKGRPLSLTPLYLERDDHVTGLIRRLSVGLRGLTLREFVVRQRLTAERTGLTGWSAGNPKRPTARPTTERLLKRFQGVTRTIIREGRRQRSHLTPLSRVQRRLLALLNFPVDIDTRLYADSHTPP